MAAQMPMEIERKYLIACPAPEVLDALPEVKATAITQTYLTQKMQGFGRRIRKRGSESQGWEYTCTQKKTVGFGERIELEDQISQAEYERLLQEANPALHTVEKVRYCFDYKNQFFELDVYSFSRDFATLEIELPDIDTPVELPDCLQILSDVTGKPGYSNYALSKCLAFPENF